MGTGQRFHLPAAFRRGKPGGRHRDDHADGKDFKAQHILGITETALNTARNQSISSSTTARIPALTLSDTTTELGSTSAPTDNHEPMPDLHLKASSVLLHEDFNINGDPAAPPHARGLKVYSSNSTLNSYYDSRRTPLSISQQTSDSSRRDFALRKGSPVVVTPPADKGSSTMRFFRSSRSRDGLEPRKLTKATPPPSNQHLPLSPASQRSSNRKQDQTTSSAGASSHSRHLAQPTQPQKGVHFYPQDPKRSISQKRKTKTKVEPVKPEIPRIKVNIRRPKAGAKHWFDGLEDDSSEQESIHEPQFHPSFVSGMELAFEDGRIGLFTSSVNSLPKASPIASTPQPALHRPTIPPRVSTLNAKSSKSSLAQPGTQRSLPKAKTTSLASTDLYQTSVLDLSSSDDDHDEQTEQRQSLSKRSGESLLPRLRDSIAIDALIESDIEVGTAKAIDTKQNSSITATPSLRRVKRGGAERKSLAPGAKKAGHGPTYLSDRSSDRVVGGDDLLTSFPPTPTDVMGSRRTSFQGSDTASIESRRLMSVTRQEESLLAAMRMKRAAIGQPKGGKTGRRLEALRSEEKATRPNLHNSKSPPALELLLSQQNRRFDSPRSAWIDKASDQASCTTFQTGPSHDPSVRFSVASFQTDTSVDTETEVLSPMSMASPTFHKNFSRISRATFFSSSSGTNDSTDQSSSRKQHAYLSALEKLQRVPDREDVSSQDFIDWPYHGWEATSRIATAQ